jgi:uncharacterized protein YkwD
MGVKNILCRALAALLAASLLGTALPLSALAQQPEEIEIGDEPAEYRLAEAVAWNGEEAEDSEGPDEVAIALPSAAAALLDLDEPGDDEAGQESGDEPGEESADLRTVTLAGRTQAEVQAALAQYPVAFRAGLAWAEQPDLEHYTTAGALSEASLQNGLNAVNLVRYIAGLAPVALDETYNNYAQHGAVCDAAIDTLTHTPTQAAGMPYDFYRTGRFLGAKCSNLYWTTAAWAGLAESVLGYMMDAGASNAADMGHRRWVLNPTMRKTGFGAAQGASGQYMSMYAFDGSRSADDPDEAGSLGAADTDGNATPYVAWPCANTPYNWAAGLMTFSLSAPANAMADITVTTRSAKTGATRVYSANNANSGDGYFVYETGSYGAPNCIIFGDYNKQTTPQFDADDTVAVTVAYTDTAGARVEVNYTISYLNADGSTVVSSDADAQQVVSTGAVLAAVAGTAVVVNLARQADRWLPVHTVLGRVQDEEGAAIADAAVTLCRSGEALKTTRTNAAGWFALCGLSRGIYSLTVETQAGSRLCSETRLLIVPAAVQKIDFVRDISRTG